MLILSQYASILGPLCLVQFKLVPFTGNIISIAIYTQFLQPASFMVVDYHEHSSMEIVHPSLTF